MVAVAAMFCSVQGMTRQQREEAGLRTSNRTNNNNKTNNKGSHPIVKKSAVKVVHSKGGRK